MIKETQTKSQFQFDVLASAKTIEILEKNDKINKLSDNWERVYSNYIYVLVGKNTNLENIQKVLDEVSKESYGDIEDMDFSFYLKPFKKIVPGAFIGNEIGVFLPKVFIIFLGGLSLIVILSAAFNYTSLSMARSLLRAKDVGVRICAGYQHITIAG